MKRRKYSYSQHRPECCLPFIKDTNWRFKAQESQDNKVDAVPKSSPCCLIKDYFSNNDPPIVIRNQFLKSEIFALGSPNKIKISNYKSDSQLSEKSGYHDYLTKLVIIM